MSDIYIATFAYTLCEPAPRSGQFPELRIVIRSGVDAYLQVFFPAESTIEKLAYSKPKSPQLQGFELRL